jgi:hypothetical protein
MISSARVEWQAPEPTPLEAILARLSAQPAHYFSGRPIRLDIVERIHRPFSELARVRVDCGSETTYAYVKRFKPKAAGEEQWLLTRDRVRRDYETSLRMLQSVKGYDGVRAVRPIACFPQELVLVTEELSGETLGAILERSARGYPGRGELAHLARVLERVGEWIRIFQGDQPKPRTFSLEAMREYLDVRLRKIVASPNDRFSQADSENVLAWFDSCAALVPASDRIEVPVHADVCPANILVDGTTVGGIDFAMASTGGLYLDVARMFTQLEFLKAKLSFRPSVVATLQSALLRGFDPHLRPDRPFFRLFVLQHTVTQFLKLTLRPGRSTARLWNWHVRRRHGHWLRALMSEHAPVRG